MSKTEEMVAVAAASAAGLAVPHLGARPRRRTAVLTCMDTRIDIEAMFGLGRGDVHLIRNAGGLATEDAIRSLSASQRLLETEEVIVIMHEGCGLEGASDEQFADALAADGAAPGWRLGAFDDVEVALRRSLARLRASPELPARDKISGFIFDPGSGVLRPCGERNEPSARLSPADG